tara:strand:+ start:263 stop:529 length:267 start_codon:yes stop_codon:yes gene_type:complete
MGKLTVKEAEALQKEGVLTEASVQEMQDKGLVSSRQRNSRRYMKTAGGGFVTPQLYFQGLNGHKYSKEMTELRDKFNKLIQPITTTKK